MVEISSILAGSLAGGCGILVGHPFDSLKVRVQIGKSLNLTKYDLHTVRQLYRGVLPPLLTTGTFSAISFSFYEGSKRFIYTWQHPLDSVKPNHQYSLNTIFWGGTLSGVCISALTVPVGMIKLQLQVHSEAGIMACARDLYAKSGMRVFYRGYASAFILESPGRGVYLWTYETVKRRLAQEYANMDSFFISICAGVCAGIFSWFVVYPADVIKARMQSDAHRVRFTSTWHCIQQTWAEGGIKSLYRGLGYTLARAGPVAASILPIYDLSKAYIDQELLGLEYQ
ncbi:solute carrier family 25 protein [archaeon]|nr:MAG: solute carrier family 25 protein [archaeon]